MLVYSWMLRPPLLANPCELSSKHHQPRYKNTTMMSDVAKGRSAIQPNNWLSESHAVSSSTSNEGEWLSAQHGNATWEQSSAPYMASNLSRWLLKRRNMDLALQSRFRYIEEVPFLVPHLLWGRDNTVMPRLPAKIQFRREQVIGYWPPISAAPWKHGARGERMPDSLETLRGVQLGV
jgi:hypothetical protein